MLLEMKKRLEDLFCRYQLRALYLINEHAYNSLEKDKSN